MKSHRRPSVVRERSDGRDRQRDPQLERQLLDAVVRQARRRFGVDCSSYVAAVERRLAVGAKRYGDDAFLERDNIAELLEETPDVAGYVLLSLQQLAGAHPEIRDDLLRAALLGAVADYYARRARRRLRDGGTR
jgi:hypothetical protein